MTFRVSQSKINTYRRCRKAYDYKYRQRIRRKFKGRPLRFGSLAHDMLEAEANGDDPFKVLKAEIASQSKLFRSEREEVEQTGEDLRVIMMDYFDYWKTQPKDKQITYTRIKGKNAEHEFEVPLKPGIVFVLKVDGIGTTGDKRKWLVEHKTFSRLPSEDHRWRNLQSSSYKWALDELKIEVDGICWDYIGSKEPTVPQILKNGEVSTRQILTLPTALREWAKREKKKISNSLMNLAHDNQKEYFSREFRPLKKAVVDTVMDDIIETAEEMADDTGKCARTIDRHCEWCEFEPLCRAAMLGLDEKFIMKKEYERYEKERLTLGTA